MKLIIHGFGTFTTAHNPGTANIHIVVSHGVRAVYYEKLAISATNHPIFPKEHYLFENFYHIVILILKSNMFVS